MNETKHLVRPTAVAAGWPSLRQSRAPRRIALFNVKYSPNLGDGLIAECLESEIRSQTKGAEVVSIDLAGRTRYEPGRADRALLLSALNASPLTVRQTVSKVVLTSMLRRRLRPLWKEKLRGVDAVVVGGGNLLSDTDLNFPLKLQTAMSVARECSTPVGVFAVGVSDNWSTQGAAMFAETFEKTPLYFASVRDKPSADVWRRRLDASVVAAPQVAYDPGVLASAHFPAPLRPMRDRPLVGIGVMHPASIRYHADQGCVSASPQTQWTVAFVAACLAQDWSVRLFSNGSPEDAAYLKSLVPALAGLGGAERIAVEPRFKTPCELARFIARLDLTYAHRLHANIAAYSYAVPHVGFSWDKKLTSFLSAVGRDECVITVGVDPVDAAVETGRRQMAIGVEPATHRAVLNRARADVADLLAAIQYMLESTPSGGLSLSA